MYMFGYRSPDTWEQWDESEYYARINNWYIAVVKMLSSLAWRYVA
jgi:hypothetical protein